MDAQRHTSDAPNAMTIDNAPLEWFYGPAVCLDLSQTAPQGWYTSKDLEKAETRSNERDSVITKELKTTQKMLNMAWNCWDILFGPISIIFCAN